MYEDTMWGSNSIRYKDWYIISMFNNGKFNTFKSLTTFTMCGDNDMFKGQEGNTNVWRYDVKKQFYKI